MLRRHAFHVLRELHYEAQWCGMDEIDWAYPDTTHFYFSGYVGRNGLLRQAISVFDEYYIVADQLCAAVNQAKRKV
jgi:hypothetical protein